MSKPVLGYWAIRGYAEQIRLLLRYLQVDFEDKQYQYGPAPGYSRESWLAEKFQLGLEFPNLPYFIDGDFKLTESKAILKYIAAAYGKNMVPDGAKETAVADMIMGVANDLQRTLVNLTYDQSSGSEAPIEDATAKPLELVVNFLGSKAWILGENITYVDFFLYEVLKQYTKFRSNFLKAQPALEAYIRKFEALPKLKDYVASIENFPTYSPYALIKY